MASEVFSAKSVSASTKNAERRSSVPTKLSALRMPRRGNPSYLDYNDYRVQVLEAGGSFHLLMTNPEGEPLSKKFDYSTRPRGFQWKQLKSFIKKNAI